MESDHLSLPVCLRQVKMAHGQRAPAETRGALLRLAASSRMATKLDKPLKRALEIDGSPYTLVIDPDGLKLTGKGKRKGIELRWQDLVSGDAALATALNASVQRS